MVEFVLAFASGLLIVIIIAYLEWVDFGYQSSGQFVDAREYPFND